MKNIVILITLSIFVMFAYLRLTKPTFLTFSDAAKFADLARNLSSNKGYFASFSYFGNAKGLPQIQNGLFPAIWTPPVFPRTMSLLFNLFGQSDTSVIASSAIFFPFLILSTYLTGTFLFDERTGLLSGLATIFSLPLLDYATQGGTEILFFTEIMIACLLFVKQKARFLAYVVLLLMYLTRPHAPIYILVLTLFDFLLRSKTPKSFLAKVAAIILLCVFVNQAGEILSGRYFIYPLWGRTANTFLQFSALDAGNTALRDSNVTTYSTYKLDFVVKTIATKVFYNLYNFYKLLPELFSPYLMAFFLISPFIKFKNSKAKLFVYLALVLVAVNSFVAAISIPFFRYLHPLAPLIYTCAIGSIVHLLSVIQVKYSKIISFSMIFIFSIGQALGAIFLDSRFQNKHLVNRDKPPVYVLLSEKLKELTHPDDIVVTNLDTWGSWYGQRRTVWYPLRPDQLIPEDGGKIADAVYITSYKMDDLNYKMGEEWRQILKDPKIPGNEFISKNYALKSIIEISASENYNKETARGILLVKKDKQ